MIGADEPHTFRDVLFPEDKAIVRIAEGPCFEGRTFVGVGLVVAGEDGDDDTGANAVVLLDAGTAVVMALDILSAAAHAMRSDPGPFLRITQADVDAANAALKARRGDGQ